MRIRRAIIDLCSVANATGYANNYRDATLSRAAAFAKKKSPHDDLCVVCATSGRVGGATCCTVQCGLCDELLRFGSTNTDALCPRCATVHGLCKHCGGDRDRINRRSRVLPAPTPPLEGVEC